MPDDVNEFSFIVKVDEMGAGATRYEISANDAQRKALGMRFDLRALDTLKAKFELVRNGLIVTLNGQMNADVIQTCIASGAPVGAAINEPFAMRFMTDATMQTEGEIELAAEDCDSLLYDGKSIDIGEAVAQSLGLALDPYPRSTEAAQILRKAGVKSEEDTVMETGPFAALSALKRQ
jgi:uncharacterized metal-binding protein YceD (DUF177 family)